jgi:tRNA (guanine26-N2/guanine27-N2)-dimethyltransferase
MLNEDTSLIGYYPVNTISSILKVNPVKPRIIVDKLRDRGYRASLTHLDYSAFKTDAPPEIIKDVFLSLSSM